MLYKYSITPEQEGLENVDLKTGKMFMLDAKNNAFTDEVSKWSMNVYSTFDLSMADNGVVEDGVGRLEEFNVPLDSNAKVVDSESDYLVFSKYFGKDYIQGAYHGSERISNIQKAFYEFSFKGDGFRLYGSQDTNGALASVYVNDKFVGYASNYAPGNKIGMMIFDSGNLPFGTYHVKVVNQNIKTVTSKDCFVSIDAVALPSMQSKFLL